MATAAATTPDIQDNLPVIFTLELIEVDGEAAVPEEVVEVGELEGRPLEETGVEMEVDSVEAVDAVEVAELEEEEIRVPVISVKSEEATELEVGNDVLESPVVVTDPVNKVIEGSVVVAATYDIDEATEPSL